MLYRNFDKSQNYKKLFESMNPWIDQTICNVYGICIVYISLHIQYKTYKSPLNIGFLFSNMFLLTFLLLQSSEYWIANGPIIVFVCVLLVTVTLCVWWRDVVPVRIWRELKETPDYLTVLSCTAQPPSHPAGSPVSVREPVTILLSSASLHPPSLTTAHSLLSQHSKTGCALSSAV